MNERNKYSYNEDAKEWSNNKCKLYLSCIIRYPFSAYRTGSTISTLFKLWLLIINKTTTV